MTYFRCESTCELWHVISDAMVLKKVTTSLWLRINLMVFWDIFIFTFDSSAYITVLPVPALWTRPVNQAS